MAKKEKSTTLNTDDKAVDLIDEVLPEEISNSESENSPAGDEDGASLESLLSEIEQQEEEQTALENAPSEEEIEGAERRARKLATGANDLVMKGLSMLYPAAKIEDEKIKAGVDSLVPLAEKYGAYIPPWLIESPEVKAGLYVGAMFYAAKKSHGLEMIKMQQQMIEAQQQIAAQNEQLAAAKGA